MSKLSSQEQNSAVKFKNDQLSSLAEDEASDADGNESKNFDSPRKFANADIHQLGDRLQVKSFTPSILELSATSRSQKKPKRKISN